MDLNNLLSAAKQDIADCLEHCCSCGYIDERLYRLLLHIVEQFLKGE